jgi:endonuclease V-like protein UPF0215 family
MPFHAHKKGIRALGIAESFVKGLSQKSFLAGVVMRADRIIDGLSFTQVTVGGIDATQQVITLLEKLHRQDINVIILNGCVISWFNVIDLQEVFQASSIPLICVTYDASEGLDKYFQELFPTTWQQRLQTYQQNGERILVTLKTGKCVFTRYFGLSLAEVKGVLNKFTVSGAVPEPIRVARLLARTLMKQSMKGFTSPAPF